MVGETAAATLRAVRACVVTGCESRREGVAGAEYLDHPDRGCDRAAARRLGVHDLHEDRLGNFAVLPDPAGAGRDSIAARAEDCAVSYPGNLPRRHARGPCRLALHPCGIAAPPATRRSHLPPPL